MSVREIFLRVYLNIKCMCVCVCVCVCVLLAKKTTALDNQNQIYSDTLSLKSAFSISIIKLKFV